MKHAKDRPASPGRSGSPRTIIPNGSLIEAYRKARGWTREEFEWQSHLAVERAALDSNDDGRFLRRYMRKTAEDKLAGIGTTTLTNVESGKPVYVFTLKIVAETLGVPIASLIAEEKRLGDRSATELALVDPSLDELIRRLLSDELPSTARDLAGLLRALLDRICRS